MTRRAFGQRRKMVRSTLKDHYPLEKVEEGLNKIGKGLKVRPEELSLAEFLVLFKEINQQ
jgi:16S rRNA (adenine1518-N6/adenine1519-N6)-dimethyltransferase